MSQPDATNDSTDLETNSGHASRSTVRRNRAWIYWLCAILTIGFAVIFVPSWPEHVGRQRFLALLNGNKSIHLSRIVISGYQIQPIVIEAQEDCDYIAECLRGASAGYEGISRIAIPGDTPYTTTGYTFTFEFAAYGVTSAYGSFWKIPERDQQGLELDYFANWTDADQTIYIAKFPGMIQGELQKALSIIPYSAVK